MPAPPPQSPSQKLLAVPLLALLAQPGALLRVCGGLQGEAAGVEAQAEDVGESDEGGQRGGGGGEGGGGEGVEGEDGEAAGGDPGGLGEEGEGEFGEFGADGEEAGVGARGGGDAGEEVGAHWIGQRGWDSVREIFIFLVSFFSFLLFGGV